MTFPQEALADSALQPGKSRITSALTKVARAFIQETMVQEDVAEELFSATDSGLNFAIKEIAQAIAQATIRKTASDSTLSSDFGEFAEETIQGTRNVSSYL